MTWTNIKLIFLREVRDQLRDRRTLFMVAVLPLLLYPALGIGMVSQLTSMNEQGRIVVVLGGEQLPQPSLLAGDQFAELTGDEFDPDFGRASRVENLKVITPQTLKLLPEEDRPDVQLFIDHVMARKADLERLAQLQDSLPAEFPEKYTPQQSRDRHEEERLRNSLQPLFAGGKVQVLLMFPQDFNAQLTSIEERLASGALGAEEQIKIPQPLVIFNGANEKSGLAFAKVAESLRAWERELLRRRLKRLNLPMSLPRPVKPVAADLAQADEIAANLWSKLFPALLVMMSITGAFYPAIDLGAGEKERGTMETLLISPATRTEIVLGKFLTVMLFSMTTALLNVASMGVTGLQMVSQVGKQSAQLGDMSLPSWPALAAVFLIAIPLASLFSALSLAIAMFARSSKEGQYYLSPLLMVTLGLTLFCSNPTYELDPYKSVLPVIGPALLLKAMLLGTLPSGQLFGYTVTVLTASAMYSGCAIWWAAELFKREDVLFREAERFDLKLWFRHLLRDKEPMPSRSEAAFCFVLIAVLQFIFMMRMPAMLAGDNSPSALPKMQFIFLVVTVGVPPLFMALMLTSDPIRSLRLRLPGAGMLLTSIVLPIALLPITLEFISSLDWFFPPTPPGMERVMAGMTDGNVPLWLALLAFAVAPAVCEELAFRGFILSGLMKSRHKWLPIVVSAVLFGMIHLIPKQIFNASLLGLVLGLLAVRSRSLWPGIVFHLIYNGLQVASARTSSAWFDNPAGRLFIVTDAEGGMRFSTMLLFVSGLVSAILIAGLIRQQDAPLTPKPEEEPCPEPPAGCVSA